MEILRKLECFLSVIILNVMQIMLAVVYTYMDRYLMKLNRVLYVNRFKCYQCLERVL